MSRDSDDKGTRDIELLVEIRAPADVVWKALTDGRELSNWFSPSAQVEKPGVGGTVTFSWGEGINWQTKVDMAEPGKHLRWLDDRQPGAPSGAPRFAVDIILTTRDATTVVRLVHSGFGKGDDWNEQYEGTKAGWAFFLYNLRLYLEQQGRRKRHIVSRRLRLAGARMGVWQRVLKSADGIAAPGAAELGVGRWVDVHLGPNGSPTPAQIEVLVPGRVIGLRLARLNSALLLIEIEPGDRDSYVGFWLSVYEERDLAAVTASFDQRMRLLERHIVA